MEVKDFVKTYDDVLHQKTLNDFINWINIKNFEDGAIMNQDGSKKLDKTVRNVKTYDMTNLTQSCSEIHFYNLFRYIFSQMLKKYENDIGFPTASCDLNQMQVLHYKPGGFYNFHVDHYKTSPRNLSIILMLNDEYEGGELTFQFKNNNQYYDYKIEKKKNRAVIWPSNFLFRHAVAPITSGERLSIVSWVL
jgi:Rps23 Pro-64 3,4-dihydroxylase Tpa1-like proline 4-hydroxylase